MQRYFRWEVTKNKHDAKFHSLLVFLDLLQLCIVACHMFYYIQQVYITMLYSTQHINDAKPEYI